MTTAQHLDAFGRPDDGTDGRRSIARSAAPCSPTRNVRLTPLGQAWLTALRLGRAPGSPAELEYITAPAWLVRGGPGPADGAVTRVTEDGLDGVV